MSITSYKKASICNLKTILFILYKQHLTSRLTKHGGSFDAS